MTHVRTEQEAEEDRAIKALIKWRRDWEKRYACAPGSGEMEGPLWLHAGILMKRRGIKSESNS